MDFMHSHLKKTVDHLEGYRDTEQCDVLSSTVNAGWLKLNEYYSLMDQSPAYFVALFLHLNYHFDYFEEQWADHKGWITKALTVIRETHERYEGDWLHKEKEKERATQSKEAEVELPGGTVDEGDFEAFGRVTGAAYRRKKRRIESQLDAYMDAGPSDSDQQVESHLHWWLTIGSA
ncbi:putative transposase [Macrophomina phaseolina MS6]|uniref:Putative transposase n=1 Tax=Macrophomina phaseolina (strain MS6) TaxID=1126212 RepID=K2RHR7_MACPH|nr:putative transposase [Macrophomina phaseolina MS6]